VHEQRIEIREQVKFRFDSADLDPAGDPVLEAVRAVLVEHPEIGKLEVQGHTDNVGARSYNLELSKDRARSVKAWLVAHGVDHTRLRSKGYGMQAPIAPNDTEDGRRSNRRVEFHIVQGAGRATP
jgi:outer membrane protein OmpA-like peptidoglycan-associated protein